MVPSVVTVPVVSPELIVGLLTVRAPPSVSVSLDKTAKEVALPPSAIVPVSSTATGASFTSLTVIVNLPVSVRKSFDPFVVPSSVMV